MPYLGAVNSVAPSVVVWLLNLLVLKTAFTRVAFVGNFFVLRTTPSHASIPPNQNGTMAKDKLVKRESALEKIQLSVR